MAEYKCNKCKMTAGVSENIYGELSCGYCASTDIELIVVINKSPVLVGEIREVKKSLIIGEAQVIKAGITLLITEVDKGYTLYEGCENILLSEVKEDVFNKDLSTKEQRRKSIQNFGSSCIGISTKWFYNNTEVVK